MRVPQWEKRLAAIIDSGKRVPFRWGLRDCALFAADCVLTITRKDPAAQWRGKYSDEAGALRFIAAAGGLEQLAEQGMIAAGIQFERIAPAFGQRGDVGLMIGQRGESLCIIEGETLVAQGPAGLVRQPFTTARIVWSIR